jgi:hypothetical protein
MANYRASTNANNRTKTTHDKTNKQTNTADKEK